MKLKHVNCLADKALLLQRDIARLERPSRTAVVASRTALLGPNGDNSKLGGNAKYMYEDESDLIALNPPLDRDALSKFLRNHWWFPAKVGILVAYTRIADR